MVPIGKKILHYRKSIDMSQGELAEGICTQAFVSQIESGNAIPNIVIFRGLLNRLGVSYEYFFQEERPYASYFDEVEKAIDTLKRKRDYKGIKQFILGEKNKPCFQHVSGKQYMLWNLGICYTHIDRNIDIAIKHFHDALAVTGKSVNSSVLSEREVEILISIAITSGETKNYDYAIKLYKKALHVLRDRDQLLDEKILIRVYYNLSRTFGLKGNFQDALNHAWRGKSLCEQYDLLYLRGELLYQVGINKVELGYLEQGISYIEKCLPYFKLDEKNNPAIYEYVENKLKLLKKSLKVCDL
ncbi:helix-turn-helix domain-containing protein [Evansella cellulosilytica]|nr:helix-turn-helix domain-containing protein [Evansella cellulosilytica]